jgi:hypothetical protein
VHPKDSGHHFCPAGPKIAKFRHVTDVKAEMFNNMSKVPPVATIVQGECIRTGPIMVAGVESAESSDGSLPSKQSAK